MKGSELKTLVPTVKWGQRNEMVILRVQVAFPENEPPQKPQFTIREEFMDFKALGMGMSGRAYYAFNLVFYEPVDTEHCRVKFTPTEIEFRLLKKMPNKWPRLQASLEKPHWIAVDFGLYEGQEESEEEGQAEDEEKVDPEKMARLANTKAQLDAMEEIMMKEVEKYKTVLKFLGKLKNGYLVVYNMAQFLGFTLVVAILLMSLRKGLQPAIDSAYENAAPILMVCQGLAMLEIVHAVTGIVRGGIIAPLMQVGGRFLMLFVVLSPAVEIHQHPVVFMLFLVWSLVELVRYPFYALSVLGVELNWLTWLRYTIWMPLYPLGFTCEASVVWLSIPHFENSDDFQLQLPNPFNISVYPPYIMRVALFVVPMIAYQLITYMATQRKRRLQKMKSA